MSPLAVGSLRGIKARGVVLDRVDLFH